MHIFQLIQTLSFLSQTRLMEHNKKNCKLHFVAVCSFIISHHITSYLLSSFFSSAYANEIIPTMTKGTLNICPMLSDNDSSKAS